MKTNGNDSVCAYSVLHADGSVYEQHIGLTKREYFAVMAMHSMLPATFSQNGFQRGTADGLADYAVKVADALIKSLNN